MTKDHNEMEHARDSEIVTTKSVNSGVLDEGGDTTSADVHEGRGEPIGHVCLMDWDDAEQRQATKWAGNMPGITAVFESSPGSYHGWNLSVDDLKTTACRILLNEDDRAHVEAGIKRGYWRLRYTPKQWDYKDGVYKDAPEFVTVTLNETDTPQSRPHYKLLRGVVDDPLPPIGKLPYDFDFVGESYTVEEYKTMTDEAKDHFTDPEAEDG